MSKSIVIIAGEPSGDNVGALFAAELKSSRPDIEMFGIGGDRMDISQVDILFHINQLAFLGFWEVIRHIPFIRRVEKEILRQIRIRKPSLAVLIDYPGFNLRLAARLKKLGIPVMYYVSPQVWAWGQGRIEKIKNLVDKMVVVFEFEKELYEKNGLAAEWYGHPLLEIVKPKLERDVFYDRIGIEPEKRYIGLFPGSRKQEVEKILPEMKSSIDEISASGLSYEGIVGCAPGLDDDFYKKIGGDSLKYVRGVTYDLMIHAELNLVASGTATLECAILRRPMLVLYKTSIITYMIAKRLVRIPFVGLVNVVAGEKIVPEFIQNHCRGSMIAPAAERLLSDSEYRNNMIERLSAVEAKLGQPGASRKAAETAILLAGS